MKIKIKVKHLLIIAAVSAVVLCIAANAIQDSATEFVNGLDQLGQEYMDGSLDELPEELK